MEDEVELLFLEPFENCLEDPIFRASFVHYLVIEQHFDLAVECSLPLLGTGQDGWYLFARAWQSLSEGHIDEAKRLYDSAQEVMSDLNWFDYRSSFKFDDSGRPLPCFPFFSPFDHPDSHEPYLYEGTEVAELAEHLRLGEWPRVLAWHREDPVGAAEMAVDICHWVEQILHLDFQQSRTALQGMSLFNVDRDDSLRYLTVLFSCDENLEAALEIFWRLRAEMGHVEEVSATPAWRAYSELVSYCYYLMGRDQDSMEVAQECLLRHRDSVICGNLYALLLVDQGKWMAANLQWRKTLQAAPHRGATFLVLGTQAQAMGESDVACRYFLEAAHLGDSPLGASKSLRQSLTNR